jgi:hypothetical protein
MKNKKFMNKKYKLVWIKVEYLINNIYLYYYNPSAGMVDSTNLKFVGE